MRLTEKELQEEKAAISKSTQFLTQNVMEVIYRFLKVGDKAPDFQLKNQREETICLDSYRHKSNIVLYFYPKASTPGCTVQACSLRDTMLISKI